LAAHFGLGLEQQEDHQEEAGQEEEQDKRRLWIGLVEAEEEAETHSCWLKMETEEEEVAKRNAINIKIQAGPSSSPARPTTTTSWLQLEELEARRVCQ